MSEKETVLVSIRDLTNRLLPDAEHYTSQPPPGWKCWTLPKKHEPIDDAIAQLISRRRAPKLKPKAALEGITCPFWYARAGVVMAVETALLTEDDAVENRRIARQSTSELLRNDIRARGPSISGAAAKTTVNSSKALNTLIAMTERIIDQLEMLKRLDPSLDAAVRANPDSLHARAQWRTDKLPESYFKARDKFLDHEKPLREALVDIRKVALISLQGISNNQPAFFHRTFIEKVAQTFEALTGTSTGGAFFRDFAASAWTSAFPDLPVPSWERIIRNLRTSDRP